MRRHHSVRERGQSLVEFAMVAPLLFVVVFAIVDFGRLFQNQVTLTNAAREGARLGATGATSSDIQIRVIATAPGMTPTVSVSNAEGTSGESVIVTANATVNLITPLARVISLIGGGGMSTSFALTSRADMRLE